MTSTIEIYLKFASIDRFLFRASDLNKQDEIPRELQERLDACHVYLLCQRPRLSIVPGSLRVVRTMVCFSVSWNVNGVAQTCETMIPRAGLPDGEFAFEVSQYPHREIIARERSGAVAGTLLLANHAHVLPNVTQEAGDLEVVYVGKGLSDSARDRLSVHGTMQRILAELNSSDPDQELFVFLYAFDRMKKNLIAVTSPEPKAEDVRRRMERAATYRPSKSEQVSLIEACMISYFRPKANVQHLDFPKKESQLVRAARTAGIGAVVVELDNEAVGDLPIGSRSVASSSSHVIKARLTELTGLLARIF